MRDVDVPKLRRLAARMNRFEAEWLMASIAYAADAGLDPLDVIERPPRNSKVIADRARAFARGLTADELEWFAEHGGDLYTDVRREWKRSGGRRE